MSEFAARFRLATKATAQRHASWACSCGYRTYIHAAGKSTTLAPSRHGSVARSDSSSLCLYVQGVA